MQAKIGSGVLSILVVLSASAQATPRTAMSSPHSVNLSLGGMPVVAPLTGHAPLSGLPQPLAVSELPGANASDRSAQADAQTGVQGLDRAIDTAGPLTQSISNSAERGGDLGTLRQSGQDLADMRLSGPGPVSANDEEAEMRALQTAVSAEQPLINKYREEMGKVIFGQKTLLDLVLMPVFVQNGHSLLIGIPGLAKTLLAETMAKVVTMPFTKIQYTADLLPSDIIGSADRNEKGQRFIRRGPVFGDQAPGGTRQLQLWDEINRAGPKVKSAVLEPMQSGKVTIEGVKHSPDQQGDKNFRQINVIGTMNPKSTAGVFPLDEAEVDRYLVSIDLERPDRESRRRISQEQSQENKYEPKAVMTEADIIRIGKLAEKIKVSREMEDYYLDLITATQPDNKENTFPLNGMVDLGASPRADIGVRRIARIHALMNNRAWVNADDVQFAARYVLRHRIFMSFKAKAAKFTADDLIEEIIKKIKPKTN